MRARTLSAAVAAAAIVAATAPADASTCYMIVDRGNEVIYQGALAPVDLSVDGDRARNAMRAAGQQLISMETDRCPPIDRARITGDGGPASVEDIVAGMRSAVSYGTGAQPTPAARSGEGIALPRITVPRDTGGGMSVGGPPSGMSIR